MIQLPSPDNIGEDSISLETALEERRSIREFDNRPLTQQELSQLLWAAQGITDPRGFRTAPSAGAIYPLEIFVTIENVTDLKAGFYRYNPEDNELDRLISGSFQTDLARAALGQRWVEEAPINLLFGAVLERIEPRYGERAKRYTDMEIGHAAQNVYLQSVASNLGTVSVGAFDENRVSSLFDLPNSVKPRLIMPVGAPRD